MSYHYPEALRAFPPPTRILGLSFENAKYWRTRGTDGSMDGSMVRWMDESMDRWIEGSMDGWMDGSMDGWINGWMEGWMDR